MVHSTFQHPPPPPTVTHCLYTIYCTLGRGGGGQRKGTVEGQQYTSIVPSFIGATVHKMGRKYKPRVNVSPVYKSVKQNAAKSVNRSTERKADI